jgi:hypothetical protein
MKKYEKGGKVAWDKDLKEYIQRKTFRPSVRETDSGKIVRVPSKKGMEKVKDDLARVGLATVGTFAEPFAAVGSGAANVGKAAVEKMKGSKEREGILHRKKAGGAVKKMAKGGSVSKRADGCATKGKTRGKFV